MTHKRNGVAALTAASAVPNALKSVDGKTVAPATAWTGTSPFSLGYPLQTRPKVLGRPENVGVHGPAFRGNPLRACHSFALWLAAIRRKNVFSETPISA